MESNANVDQIPYNDTWYFLSNLTKEKTSFHVIGGFAWGAPEPNFPRFDGLYQKIWGNVLLVSLVLVCDIVREYL